MGGVDIVDQKTTSFRLDCKSKYHFYVRVFFDLVDVALVNIYKVYTKLDNHMPLLNFKAIVTKGLIEVNVRDHFPTVGQANIHTKRSLKPHA